MQYRTRPPSILRMSGALMLANLRYWRTVAPLANAQLRYWVARAEAIPSPQLQRIALENLRNEGFNAQATATLATLAPSRHRPPAVEAIVGLQVTYDYLDSLVEQPHPDPIANGRHLYYEDQNMDDGGYLDELVATVRTALLRLPNHAATKQVAICAAERCSEAQVRAHATAVNGEEQLHDWASNQRSPLALGWREFLAGAVSSGLSLHALSAFSAAPLTTEEKAEKLDRAYLSLCAITTLLDGLVDYQEDLDAMGHAGYIRYYESGHDFRLALKVLIQRTADELAGLPDATHHLVTLSGIVAYYLSAPTMVHHAPYQVADELRRDLGPLLIVPLAVMRTWRFAKRRRTSTGREDAARSD
jgi:tetraprenyl-beta-curcumene synthase